MRQSLKLKVMKYFSLPFTLFGPYGAVFMINSKIHLRKNSSKRVFQNHFALFRCLFTLGLCIGRSINGLVFFFDALGEGQVTVLSVLKHPSGKMKKSFGDRSFSVAAPTLWNALPVSLRSIKCISTFKSNLKTYLFKLAFNIS